MYCCDFGAILICQKPDLKSIDEKCADPAMLSNTSWMWGKGYESFFVRVLRHLKLTQKHSVPSFFQTKTTTLHHSDWLGWIAPVSSISLRESHTSSNKGGGIRQNRFLNDSLFSMCISCSMALVQPNSLLSNTNTSW